MKQINKFKQIYNNYHPSTKFKKTNKTKLSPNLES